MADASLVMVGAVAIAQILSAFGFGSICSGLILLTKIRLTRIPDGADKADAMREHLSLKRRESWAFMKFALLPCLLSPFSPFLIVFSKAAGRTMCAAMYILCGAAVLVAVYYAQKPALKAARLRAEHNIPDRPKSAFATLALILAGFGHWFFTSAVMQSVQEVMTRH